MATLSHLPVNQAASEPSHFDCTGDIYQLLDGIELNLGALTLGNKRVILTLMVQPDDHRYRFGVI